MPSCCRAAIRLLKPVKRDLLACWGLFSLGATPLQNYVHCDHSPLLNAAMADDTSAPDAGEIHRWSVRGSVRQGCNCGRFSLAAHHHGVCPLFVRRSLWRCVIQVLTETSLSIRTHLCTRVTRPSWLVSTCCKPLVPAAAPFVRQYAGATHYRDVFRCFGKGDLLGRLGLLPRLWQA